MLLTPLEQFQIISLFSVKLFSLDFSFTNLFLINVIVLAVFSLLISFISADDSTFFFVPNNWQTLIETVFETVSQLLFDNINIKGEKYFPFISVLFLFILLVNLVGQIGRASCRERV